MAVAGTGTPTTLDRLLASGPPLDVGEWALTPSALELVLGEIEQGRDRVVECGSGASTIVIARLLRRRAAGLLCALEHDPHWATETRRRLTAERLDHRARVIEAPLRPHPLAEPGCEWYDETALSALPDAIDLLLVDGPPAPPGSQLERARYPALPVLAGRLATGATVILDDAGREGEIWVVDRWQRELGMRFKRPQGERIAIGCRFRSPDQEGSWANQFERTE